MSSIPQMHRRSRAQSALILASCVLFATACGRSVLDDGSGTTTPPDPDGGSVGELIGLEIAPTEIQLAPEAQVSLRALAIYDDGTTAVVTEETGWESSAPEVAGVDEIGTVLAISGGTALVTGTYEGFSSAATIDVLDLTEVVGLEVDPPVLELPIEGRGNYTATALLSDGSTQDVTEVAVWEFEGEELGNLEAGEVVADRPGETTVTASLGAFTASALLRVIEARLESIEVTPISGTTGVGGTVRYTAEGIFSDGSRLDISASVGWSTDDEEIASISDEGVATGNEPGDTRVRASFMGIEGTATLSVTASSLIRIEIAPVDPTLGAGFVQRFTATGIYSDGSTADLTASAVWSSSEPAVATIDASGQLTTIMAGETLVTATASGRRGASRVTVTGATLSRVTIDPVEITLGVDDNASLRAVAEYTDGTTMEVTEAATWSSDESLVAEVSNAAGTRGRVTGRAVGATTVQATFDGMTGTADVTVSAAELELIAIEPEVGMTSAGGTVAYRAVGRYFDGVRRTYRTVTTSVTWATAERDIATISNAVGTEGVATGVSTGSTTVIATIGAISGRAMIVITAATLTGIAISPAGATTTAGLRTDYTAEATYSDGSTADVTAMVMWSTTNSDVATISNAAGIEGQLLARGEGRTVITATLDGARGTTTVAVLEPMVVELQVTPVGATVAVGGSVQYQAVVVYSDGTSRNVTRMADWSSSNTRVASMGMGRFGQGRATGESVGSVTITARAEGLSGSQTLNVTTAEIASISITPAVWDASVGEDRRFSAQAIYTDGTIMDVTAAGTWTSTNTRVAEVSNAFRWWGLVNTVGAGTTTIRMTYMGLSGSATVTVTSSTITEIQVTPFMPSAAAGSPVQFQAVAIYSDGSSSNITTDVTWTSSRTTVAQVSNARGSWGRATTLAAGTTTITATYMSMTGTSTLTVTAATIERIQVTPFIPTLPVDLIMFMQATAIYTDGSTMNITNMATWSSSAPTVAAVSNARGTRGMATALSGGTADIIATYDGSMGSTRMTVIDSALRSITVTPATATVRVAGNQQFTAMGLYADGTMFDLTAFVTWSSSDVTIADVSNAWSSWGRATGFRLGMVTVTARLGASTGTASLTVM